MSQHWTTTRICRQFRLAVRAFSLVELLVVIAVIAVILSLLVPAISNTRSLVRTRLCATNMHQQGQMFAQYGADAKDFIAPTASQHKMLTTPGTENLVMVTTNTATGQLCPFGAPKFVATGFGWFYWQGYLPPVRSNARKVAVLDCPDAPIKPGHSVSYTQYTASTAGFSALASTTATLAAQNGDFSVTGSNWDCVESAPVAYFYRGWARDGGYYPRASTWKPGAAVAVDFEFREDGVAPYEYKEAHGDGLNILFQDGHVNFGGKDLPGVGPYAGMGMLKPHVYFTGKYFASYTLDVAKGSGNSASSGWPYPGGNAQRGMWNYYETGER